MLMGKSKLGLSRPRPIGFRTVYLQKTHFIIIYIYIYTLYIYVIYMLYIYIYVIYICYIYIYMLYIYMLYICYIYIYVIYICYIYILYVVSQVWVRCLPRPAGPSQVRPVVFTRSPTALSSFTSRRFRQKMGVSAGVSFR